MATTTQDAKQRGYPLTNEQLDECREAVRSRAKQEYEAHRNYLQDMAVIQDRYLETLKIIGADHIPQAQLTLMFVYEALGLEWKEKD